MTRPRLSVLRCSAARARRRRGTATVELAVALPVLVVLVFGAIEASSMIFVKQGLTICAYEAARAAALPKGTQIEADQAAAAVAAARGLVSTTISYDTPLASLAPGDVFTCTVSAPAEANAPLPVWFFGGRDLSGAVTMMKE